MKVEHRRKLLEQHAELTRVLNNLLVVAKVDKSAYQYVNEARVAIRQAEELQKQIPTGL